MIDIPSKVTRLEDSCFIYCNRLTNITLPETVTHLGNACFSGCEMLGDITCLATTAPTLDPNVFGNSIETYTGINAATKTLTVPSNATGYDKGDWDSVLQDKVGFTLIENT